MFLECVGVVSYGEHHVSKASIKFRENFFKELRDMLYEERRTYLGLLYLSYIFLQEDIRHPFKKLNRKEYDRREGK